MARWQHIIGDDIAHAVIAVDRARNSKPTLKQMCILMHVVPEEDMPVVCLRRRTNRQHNGKEVPRRCLGHPKVSRFSRHFTVATDPHTLYWLWTLKNLSGRLRLGFSSAAVQFYVYLHIRKKNLVADLLSRCLLSKPPNHDCAPTELDLPIAPIPYDLVEDTLNLPSCNGTIIIVSES